MNETEHLQPEAQPKPQPEPTATTTAGPEEAPKPETEAKPPSRFRRFLRRLLWTLALLLVLYAAGFLTAIVLVVQPLQDRLGQAEQAAQNLQGQATSLNEQLAQKDTYIRELEARIQNLEGQLQQVQEAQKALEEAQARMTPYIALLQSLHYGYRAALALQQEDLLAARLAWQTLLQHLETVQQTAPENVKDGVSAVYEQAQNLLPQLATDPTTYQKILVLVARMEDLEPLLQPTR